jgi:hypothetical protein
MANFKSNHVPLLKFLFWKTCLKDEKLLFSSKKKKMAENVKQYLKDVLQQDHFRISQEHISLSWTNRKV